METIMETNNNEEQILVSITGQDRPGLTASVMGILAHYEAQILDIGQADIHNTLSLGILFRIGEKNSGQVLKELLFKANELGVNIGFSPITDDEYEEWVNRQGKNRHILTLIGRRLTAAQIEAAASQRRGQHRLHPTPHRPPKHQAPPTEEPRLHRVLTPRHPQPPQDASQPHAPLLGDGIRLLTPE